LYPHPPFGHLPRQQRKEKHLTPFSGDGEGLGVRFFIRPLAKKEEMM